MGKTLERNSGQNSCMDPNVKVVGSAIVETENKPVRRTNLTYQSHEGKQGYVFLKGDA